MKIMWTCPMPLCDMAFMQEIKLKFRENVATILKKVINGTEIMLHGTLPIDLQIFMVLTSQVML